MPSSSAYFVRRHDLAARDARHVGDDRLDFGDAVVFQELLDVAHRAAPCSRAHARPCRRPRTARVRTGFPSPSIPGATARRARRSARRRRETPRSRRRSAVASVTSRGASRSTPCECSEFTLMRSGCPRCRAGAPPSTSSISCTGPYCSSSGASLSSRWSRLPGMSCSFWHERAAEGDVHLLEAAADAEDRHARDPARR